MSTLWPAELQLKNTLEKQWRRFVRVYHNEESLKKARETIPFVQLTIEAQKKQRSATAANTTSQLSIKEYLFLELLRWFKLSFFKWVDKLQCSSCGGATTNREALSPTPEELRYGADRVENHFCAKCNLPNRFPRYNCPVKLLETRRGRCGEWANCFVLCSRALGFETRYILDETDHVWCEVFSEALGSRWVHADPCENCFDKPLLYEKGWKKKLSYIFAFSSNQVVDVSWRYSQKHSELLGRRKKYRESVVSQLIRLLNDHVRLTVSDGEWALMSRRSITEGVEFLNNDSNLNVRLSQSSGLTGGAEKYSGRTTGSVEWRLQRGELGNQQGDGGDCDTGSTRSSGNGFIFDINASAAAEQCGGGSANVTYCPVQDEYCFDDGAGNVSHKSLWHSAVHSCDNIYRKEEFDWKMVYLARDPENEGALPGWIEWKFRLPSPFIFTKLKIVFVCKLYEDASVTVSVMDNSSNSRPLSTTSESDDPCEVDVSGWKCRELRLRAQLQGGRGEVAWQHAQLFRQSLEQPHQYPFNLSLSFSATSS